MQKKIDENTQFEKKDVRKSWVLEQLKESGCRITKQREALIDIILNKNCSSCKEIYYWASKSSSGIGIATIYRMMNLLEEMGIIQWKNGYRINETKEEEPRLRVHLEDSSVLMIEGRELVEMTEKGLASMERLKGHRVKKVSVIREN